MTVATPKPGHNSTFGLWMVGNVSRNLLGDPVREAKSPVELIHLLAEVGTWGVNFHDSVLIPLGMAPAERNRIVWGFNAAPSEMSVAVPMMTNNLFNDPVFRNSVFTYDEPKVRAYTCKKRECH